MGWPRRVGQVLLFLAWVYGMSFAVRDAFEIRLHAIKTFGYVIHEFDPWFNYRATVYLRDNGIKAFFTWFDRKSWYPLGRPVGTTIYPGMQLTSVGLWNALNWLRDRGFLTWWKLAKKPVELNDVCCLVPAWFGVSATVLLALLTGECTGSWTASLVAACIMAIVPAHLMRSVGGGYDNESIALTAMCGAFYLWCRALRGEDHGASFGEKLVAWRRSDRATWNTYVFGALAGLAYVDMVAAWGGFVFVINLIAVHVAVLVAVGRYTPKLHVAYSLLYAIGTTGAVFVPVVGWRPLKDMELLAPLLAFIGLQFLAVAEHVAVKEGASATLLRRMKLRAGAAAAFAVFIAAIALVLYPRGYFGPMSSRVRGLFVKHTRTGNPLVDSVAEHQPASAQAYEQYLHRSLVRLAPWGLALSACFRLSDGNVFLIVYALVAYFFANKMARLIILLGPVASALGGVALGFLADALVVNALGSFFQAFVRGPKRPSKEAPDVAAAAATTTTKKKGGATAKPASVPNKKKNPVQEAADFAVAGFEGARRVYRSRVCCVARLGLFVYVWSRHVEPEARAFADYAFGLSEGLSQPSIMFKARLRDGTNIIVDDYREAYWWLRDHTPKDSRILAWWDYGYQITGIGERTTLADGNTWNHEHIATLGRILSAPEEEAHKIARHLADYVLVWAGGGGDDLAKSPHMARIGNSVYRDICPGDPTCTTFGFNKRGQPTKMMKESLLYKLITDGRDPAHAVDKTRWQHAFSSKYGKVRIYKILKVSKQSRAWVANETNWLCDAPGSWYCPGQYPPAIQWLIDKRRPFSQLEDFNTKKRKVDEDAEYQREYHRRLEATQQKAASSKVVPPKKQLPGGGSSDEDDAERSNVIPTHAGDLEVSLKYKGCYKYEAQLPKAKMYGGGGLATTIQESVEFAVEEGKKFVALSRVHEDGHVFIFNDPPSGQPLPPGSTGCDRPCLDDPAAKCGCADGGCEGLDRQPGDDLLRRWSVYEVTTGAKMKTATANAAAAAAAASSSEL